LSLSSAQVCFYNTVQYSLFRVFAIVPSVFSILLSQVKLVFKKYTRCFSLFIITLCFKRLCAENTRFKYFKNQNARTNDGHFDFSINFLFVPNFKFKFIRPRIPSLSFANKQDSRIERISYCYMIFQLLFLLRPCKLRFRSTLANTKFFESIKITFIR